ncbi:MAG: RAMP superfamily CRISPR-associated protein [Candidatus Methanospirare jalkutatii]|nr:MAG: RAMP superfamily CRISPR-associated protein [Candidatus Methanospirare jalkutatii]UYZ40795.1 MAG: RAMP superfamily CRISPR-associated protein [Candidatus Methanospirare jalkutatii]
MSEKIKIKIDEEEKEFEIKEEGKMKILELPVVIKVKEKSFLHIGAAPSPLTEKKGAIFKVDRTPVIPATSFKGALRHQLELRFIEKIDEFADLFNVENKEMLKPCIPSPRPSKAEEELINSGKYRKKAKLKDKEITGCQISVDNENILVPKIENQEVGICPVCYFMGCGGLMGFLRFSNFYPEGEGSVIDQTNIRIDRKTGTAARGAKVEGEQVKPGTVFKGNIGIVISEPILEMQGIQFGDARKIDNEVIDKWLENWNETGKDKRVKTLIEKILIPAIQNIKVLGGQKSRGAGKVNVSVNK